MATMIAIQPVPFRLLACGEEFRISGSSEYCVKVDAWTYEVGPQRKRHRIADPRVTVKRLLS